MPGQQGFHRDVEIKPPCAQCSFGLFAREPHPRQNCHHFVKVTGNGRHRRFRCKWGLRYVATTSEGLLASLLSGLGSPGHRICRAKPRQYFRLKKGSHGHRNPPLMKLKNFRRVDNTHEDPCKSRRKRAKSTVPQ